MTQGNTAGNFRGIPVSWLIKSVPEEFEMPPEQAADEVAILCDLAKEMMPNKKRFIDRVNAAT